MPIIILIFLIFTFNVNSQDISEIRKVYLTAPHSNTNCEKLGKLTKEIKDNISPLIIGYKASYYFIKCNFITNPANKIISFNKGKKLIQQAIKQEPKSVELRLLRYAAQKNSPKFLMYNKHIKEDLYFLANNLAEVKNINTKEYIKYSLNKLEE